MVPLSRNRQVSKRVERAFRLSCAVHFRAVALVVLIGCQLSVFHVHAALHETYSDSERTILQERAVPKAAGDYYRQPGKFIESEGGTRWFGPEIDSRVLCPKTAHRFNQAGFFEVIYTREDAEVWPSSRPGRVWWYRRQVWRFATADTPWGTDTVHVTLVSEIGWAGIDAADTVTGFPWSGFEEHWREGEIVKSEADVTGYHQYEHAGKKYLTPKYYKRGTLSYFCPTGRGRPNLKVLTHGEGHFTTPEFRPEVNRLSLREKGVSKTAAEWYDCIPLK